jgi:Transcriptional regulator PadR-like family
MTHAHGMREEGFCWEPGDVWRGARHWLAAAGRGRGGPRGFGGPWGRHGGRRPRGDVRAAILVLLDEEPRNGYGIMQEIEERSAGAWRPSPGSVYPVLQQLEDEGLVRAAQTGERKLMELTEEGKAYVDERR